MKKIMAPLVLAGLVAGLSSCNSGSTPTVQPTQVMTIRGQVVSGSGAGKVTFSGAAGEIASAPVDSAGNFSLTLPSVDRFSSELVTVDQVLNKVGCTGALTSSVPAAKGYAIAGLQLSRGTLNDTVLSGVLNVSKLFGVTTGGSFDGKVWVYTDQGTQLTGQVDCTQLVGAGLPVKITVNASTTAGWNILSLTGTAGLSGSGISVSGNLTNSSNGQTTWRTLADLKAVLN